MMTIHKEALMLDAGFAALPLLRAVQNQYFSVTVCSGKGQDPGHQFADNSVVQNYADRDAVLSLARKRNISALLPGVTDVSYLTGAWIAQQLGLPGFDNPDVSEILFKKDVFREWATRHGYPIPQAVKSVEEAQNLKLPLLVKPVDAYSGLGIAKVDQWSMLGQAIKAARSASSSGHIVIETFCEGQLYSHSAFIRNGKIACEFFVDEYCTVYPWQVNSSCLSVLLTPEMRALVHDCLQSLVTELGLTDGLLHTQFIANDSDFWLIELTRRCPGDLYSRLIELSTGIPYSLYFTQPFLAGNDAFASRQPPARRAIVRHTVSLDKPGLFTSFHYALTNARIVETIPLKVPGERINAAPHDRAGIIFAELSNFSELSTRTPELKASLSLNGQ